MYQLLNDPPIDANKPTAEQVKGQQFRITRAFNDLRVDADTVDYFIGPTITRHRIVLNGRTRIAQVVRLADDLALRGGFRSVRVVQSGGKVYLEVPNEARETVVMADGAPYLDNICMDLPVFIGKNVSGDPIVEDLARMPHVLVAGTTGSGKSVLVNSIIVSLLLMHGPETLRLVLVDPKMVELSAYNGIPHLDSPVITDMQEAADALDRLVDEMESRYETLREAGQRNIKGYNENGGSMPYIVVVIDELADLMMQFGKDVERPIVRVAQKARAVGIHLVLATQRPSTNVVTGIIKANVPARIAMKVASGVDSRVVLDRVGAERLLGHGDMLILSPGDADVVRAQGALLGDDEISRVVRKCQSTPYAQDDAPSEQEPEHVPDRSAVTGMSFRMGVMLAAAWFAVFVILSTFHACGEF